MGGLTSVLAPIAFVNETVLRLGRAVGVVAIVLMVIAILIQVFFRYVLGNALPWPDEAAKRSKRLLCHKVIINTCKRLKKLC